MPVKVLVTPRSYGKTDPAVFGMLQDKGITVVKNETGDIMSREQIMEAIAGCDGVILGVDPMDAEVMAAAPKLRAIAKYGVGVDNIDLAAAQQRGIKVSRTVGANSEAVADYAFALMIALAFMYICRGIGMLSYQGHPPTILDPVFVALPKLTLLGIPFITWIAILMLLLCWFIQEYTAFGRYIYAVGTNESIPRSVGVNVDLVKVKVFTLAGFLFGVAGVLGAIRLGQGQVGIGDDMMFPAQAAVVIGGTSLAGGKGGVINTIVGVLIMTVLNNGLLLLGVNPYVRTGIQGLIILIAVILTIPKGGKIISK